MHPNFNISEGSPLLEATFQKDLYLNSMGGTLLRQFSAEDCISLQSLASHLQPQPSSPKMEVVKAILYLHDHQTSSQLVYHCQPGSQMPEMKTIDLVNDFSSKEFQKIKTGPLLKASGHSTRLPCLTSLPYLLSYNR